MRIIAGRLGGRNFSSPRTHRTHPMSDKVRGALFNALGDIRGLSVLDPFAGTGALGFEALSRGAASVVFVENDKSAQQSIEDNISELDVEESVRLIRANCASWSDHNPKRIYDLVLLDPPYDAIRFDLIEEKLPRHVAPEGLLVVSWPSKREEPRPIKGFDRLDTKQYGDAKLLFYRRSPSSKSVVG